MTGAALVRRAARRPELALAVLVSCAGQPPVSPVAPGADPGPSADEMAAEADTDGLAAALHETAPEADVGGRVEPPPAPPALEPADPLGPEVWLKGCTHVHARPSGDSSEPMSGVIAWYEDHHYDFIVITDHNKVSELDAASDTRGRITLRDPSAGLIVFSGIELTHNPIGCLPMGDPSRNCRIHVNLLGPVSRPGGRLEWAERRSHARIDMYRAAQVAQIALGGLAQINHPQWLWGMNPELLAELARRGMPLMEIANSAFAAWNAGDATHPSTEALWDAVLTRGVTLWGVASDDAHDYHGHGKYPPGGGWVVVRARRDPQAILEALAAGRFYASNGVVLERVQVDDGALVVAVDPVAAGNYTIDFIENGQRVESIRGKVARRTLPARGYLRAIVLRDDGKRAWVQPVRR